MPRLATILILAISLTLGAAGSRAAPALMPGGHDCAGGLAAPDGCDHDRAHHRAKPIPMACGALACCAGLTILAAGLPASTRSGPGLRLARIQPVDFAHCTSVSETDPPIPRHCRRDRTD